VGVFLSNGPPLLCFSSYSKQRSSDNCLKFDKEEEAGVFRRADCRPPARDPRMRERWPTELLPLEGIYLPLPTDFQRSDRGTYSLRITTLLYAGLMIVLTLTSSSILWAHHPAILAMAKMGVQSSSGIFSML